MTDVMHIGSAPPSIALEAFRELLQPNLVVLEMGTKQFEPGFSTHHADWFEDSEHIKTDIEDGEDVDIVADAHFLTETFMPNTFDAIVAVSVWEHLARPWICAEQVFEVLKPGGLLYVCTHHTFPIHGYPSDYCRWTDHGLTELFTAAGFDVLAAGYTYPCQIVPDEAVSRWNPAAPAYLNVDIVAIKGAS